MFFYNLQNDVDLLKTASCKFYSKIGKYKMYSTPPGGSKSWRPECEGPVTIDIKDLFQVYFLIGLLKLDG